MMSCYFGFLIPEISFIDEVVCSVMYFESESGFRSCDIIPTKFFPEHLRLHLFWVIFLPLNFQVYDTLVDWRATVISAKRANCRSAVVSIGILNVLKPALPPTDP